MPSLAIHDVTGSTPGLPGRACFQLPGVFGISRNQRSASSEIGVRLGPKSLFGFPRNGCSFSPVLHNLRTHSQSLRWTTKCVSPTYRLASMPRREAGSNQETTRVRGKYWAQVARGS